MSAGEVSEIEQIVDAGVKSLTFASMAYWSYRVLTGKGQIRLEDSPERFYGKGLMAYISYIEGCEKKTGT